MIERISAPNDLLERWLSACLRGFLRITFRSLIGSKLSVHAQRKWVDALALLLPGNSGIKKHVRFLGDISVTTLMPKRVQKDGVILFLHGGAFCLGNPYTHRSLCTRLGLDSGLPIWIPDYRLACDAALHGQSRHIVNSCLIFTLFSRLRAVVSVSAQA